MKRLAILAVLGLTGCSTAGPFVTNISSDGQGGLVVEKCMVQFNGFLGTISNQEATTTRIYLGNLPQASPPRAK